MFETMIDADGAGLAAPQVHKPIRIAICTFDEGVIVLINPILPLLAKTKSRPLKGACPSMGSGARWCVGKIYT